MRTVSLVACAFAIALVASVGITHHVDNVHWEKKLADMSLEQERLGIEDSIPLTDWEVLVMAIAKTESDFNFLARGNSGDLGVLQCTNIWVKEVNNILGEQKYLHTDALDPRKSLEMFNIMQDRHNPDKDINKAIKLHNPGGDTIGYSIKVMKNMEWIRNYEKVRNLLRATQNLSMTLPTDSVVEKADTIE